MNRVAIARPWGRALMLGLAATALWTATAGAQEVRPRRRRPILNYFFGRPEYSVYRPIYGANPPGKIVFSSYAGYNYGQRRPRMIVEPPPPPAVLAEPPTVVAPPPAVRLEPPRPGL